jgi:hypothetical protein
MMDVSTFSTTIATLFTTLQTRRRRQVQLEEVENQLRC